MNRELCSSVLHLWNYYSHANLQLWLEIATIGGEPIRLRLPVDLRVTPRQVDAQWNQLVPVLPF
ncbi:hypothetical protein ACCD02_32805, partial [Pseudomonas sp. Pseusp88]